jgi:hypothetical protein
MPFQRYYEPDHFLGHAEFGLGFHVVSTYLRDGLVPRIFILFSHEFLPPIDEIFRLDPALAGVPPEQIEDAVRRIAVANPYSSDLQPCDQSLFTSHPLLRALTSGPGGYPVSDTPPPIGAPPVQPLPYGHLPFSRTRRS